MPQEELDDVDRAILEIEARTYRFVGTKERRIRERTGLTPTRYFVRLNRLLESPAALQHSPAVVNRLRTLRQR
ncbi:DUF3263 domain-containing protein [Brachybacterium phenoliresistens]|uniref:DUF3263 domain-containing protein n=1 Tax=Brachybacterium phenoliresistens TaxID=396014 RepID=UPI0031D53621